MVVENNFLALHHDFLSFQEYRRGYIENELREKAVLEKENSPAKSDKFAGGKYPTIIYAKFVVRIVNRLPLRRAPLRGVNTLRLSAWARLIAS